MESHWCVSVNNTNINPRKYYPPGIASALAIAACTFVCLVCMFIDIVTGIRKRKPWIPCKFFALNSITLSILGLAARYPTDRTTLMLSAEDQLCKLSGTVLICICMGFFMPSLGVEKGQESIKNMASLSILVLAVEFNVMAQMFTGVIFAFFFEHFVILFFMFVLLVMLWTICLEVTQGKGAFNEFKKGYLKLNQVKLLTTEHMLSRLEWCYIFGYTCSPQFLLGLVTHCATIGLICTLCVLSLLEAAVGSFVFTELKFCDRSFKSGWTMQMVLMVQIITIIVGMSGIGYRWYTMVCHFKFNETDSSKKDSFYLSVYENLYSLPWILSGTFYFNVFRIMETLLTWALIKIAKLFEMITNFVLKLSHGLSLIFRLGQESVVSNSTREEHFRNAIPSRGHPTFINWILQTAVMDMDRLIDQYKKDPPTSLIDLLLNRPQSRSYSLAEVVEFYNLPERNDCWSQHRVSCLTVVVLVRLVDAALPSCSSTLINSLHECFDIIYLIDKCTHVDKWNHVQNMEDEKRFMLAEDLWMCRDFKLHWYYKKIFAPSIMRHKKQSAGSGRTPNVVALEILEEIMEMSKKDELRGFDLWIVAKSIIFLKKLWDIEDDVYCIMEQMFVDLFYYFLAKLPKLIETYVHKSGVEDCGERAKCVMKLVCKVQQLEDRVGRFRFNNDSVSVWREFHASNSILQTP